MRQAGLGFTLGAAIGGATAFLLIRPRKSELSEHPALKYGVPSSHRLRLFREYAVEYDSRTRGPTFVIERITKESNKRGGGSRQNIQFGEDSAMPPRFRARLADFRGSGYDRGHMAPSANHLSSPEACKETFTLTNISPQVGPGFNRDYWARFERFVKQLGNACEEVWCVTGALYAPGPAAEGHRTQHAWVGQFPRLVAVPSHFYKVVLAVPNTADPVRAVGAFVLPNAAIPPDTPLTAFAVPLGDLEDLAGLEFFPKLGLRYEAADAAALALGRASRGRLGAAQQPPLALARTLTVAAEARALSPPPETGMAQLEQLQEHLGGSPAAGSEGASPARSRPLGPQGPPPPAAVGAVRGSSSLARPEVSSSTSEVVESGGLAEPPAEQSYGQLRPRGRRRGQEDAGEAAALCDEVVCALPPVGWYLQGKAKAAGRDATPEE